MSLEVARHVKERYCYSCSDLVKEFDRMDRAPSKYMKQYTGTNPKTGEAREGQVYGAVYWHNLQYW
jgi:hypothetical protein